MPLSLIFIQSLFASSSLKDEILNTLYLIQNICRITKTLGIEEQIYEITELENL